MKSNKMLTSMFLALGLVVAGSGVVLADGMMKSAEMMDKNKSMSIMS